MRHIERVDLVSHQIEPVTRMNGLGPCWGARGYIHELPGTEARNLRLHRGVQRHRFKRHARRDGKCIGLGYGSLGRHGWNKQAALKYQDYRKKITNEHTSSPQLHRPIELKRRAVCAPDSALPWSFGANTFNTKT